MLGLLPKMEEAGRHALQAPQRCAAQHVVAERHRLPGKAVRKVRIQPPLHAGSVHLGHGEHARRLSRRHGPAAATTASTTTSNCTCTSICTSSTVDAVGAATPAAMVAIAVVVVVVSVGAVTTSPPPTAALVPVPLHAMLRRRRRC